MSRASKIATAALLLFAFSVPARAGGSSQTVSPPAVRFALDSQNPNATSVELTTTSLDFGVALTQTVTTSYCNADPGMCSKAYTVDDCPSGQLQSSWGEQPIDATIASATCTGDASCKVTVTGGGASLHVSVDHQAHVLVTVSMQPSDGSAAVSGTADISFGTRAMLRVQRDGSEVQSATDVFLAGTAAKWCVYPEDAAGNPVSTTVAAKGSGAFVVAQYNDQCFSVGAPSAGKGSVTVTGGGMSRVIPIEAVASSDITAVEVLDPDDRACGTECGWDQGDVEAASYLASLPALPSPYSAHVAQDGECLFHTGVRFRIADGRVGKAPFTDLAVTPKDILWTDPTPTVDVIRTVIAYSGGDGALTAKVGAITTSIDVKTDACPAP
jgi:hypothetical protein